MTWLKFAALAAPICVLAGAASAQPKPDPMAAYYGATLKIEIPDMYEGLRWFEPDHTFRDRDAAGRGEGTWTIEGDRICTQRPGAPKYCNLGLGKQVGETWGDRDPYTLNEVTFTLVAGRKDAS